MGRIVVFVVLALLGVFGGDLPGFAGAPLVAAEPARIAASVAPDEPAADPESTASLDESPDDESVGVTLAPSPAESGAVVAPSFVRAPVVARGQAAPPTFHQEIPPRPPRG
jgi:hypothetical protein